MTDDTHQSDVDAPPPGQASPHPQEALAARIRADNKAVVFDALDRAGIAKVVVVFDGYGDSGQIESIEVDGAITELPSESVQLANLAFDGTTIEHMTRTLSDAIEALVYDFLEETHSGWEDSEGAYGDFTFDVGSRIITLAYNERRMDSDYSEHQF